MSSENVYELDVTVRSADGTEATIHREYHTSKDKPADALNEVWGAVNSDTKARMRSVADGA